MKTEVAIDGSLIPETDRTNLQTLESTSQWPEADFGR